MKRIHLANILLVCVLGTILLWPTSKKPITHESISTAYDSICMVSSGAHYASGVLLESGYVLTAAHVVDHDGDGKIDKNEETHTLRFQALPHFRYQAKVLAIGEIAFRQDVALLKPTEKIPLTGVKMMPSREYRALPIGTPVYTIGMQNGEFPGNVTDGRLVQKKTTSHLHRNSANTYFGNSGGGVFIGDRLVGIATAVGMGRLRLSVPMFDAKGIFHGQALVVYTVPLANSSLHVPVTSVREFIVDAELEDALREKPTRCPYESYFAVIGFNVALIVWLGLAFYVLRRWMK